MDQIRRASFSSSLERRTMRSRSGYQPSDPELELRQVEYQEIKYRHASETSASGPRARFEMLNESTTYVTPSATTTTELSMFNLLIDNLPGPRTVLGGLRWIASPKQALSTTLARGRLTAVEEEEEEQPGLMIPSMSSSSSTSIPTSSSELPPPPLPRRRHQGSGRAEAGNGGDDSTRTTTATESADRNPAPIDLDRYMPDLALVKGVVSGVSLVANTVRSVAGRGSYWENGRQAQGDAAPFNGRSHRQHQQRQHADQAPRHQPDQQVARSDSRTTQDDSERLMYINGALHVLRGLPRDLEPGEIAMLQRAMPPALATGHSSALQQQGPYGLMAAEPWAGDPYNRQQQPNCASRSGDRRNLVHVLVLALLCWLWAAAEAVVPWAAAAGRRAARAEHEHGYLPRLLVAASGLLLALLEVSRRVCECRLFEVLVALVGYATTGMGEAVREFVEGKVGEKWKA
ncbi:hypothetical protein VTJ83DRAFT_4915 [Remersonia thermophila]|uniref:Uncharacterized protein n=1 Tax=Remersonia thermophila TaxID=72144 RepID=A0ABR4DBA4_9PEZI